MTKLFKIIHFVPFMTQWFMHSDVSGKCQQIMKQLNKEAIWLYAELFLGHHDGSCHGLW